MSDATEEVRAHAILSPSGADRWMTCLGSTALCVHLPDTTSSYAEEGTDHHYVAAYCLEEKKDAIECVNREMPSGARLTEENAKFVQQYVDFVRSHKDEHGILLAEEEVPISHLTGEPLPNGKGTADAVILRGDRELFIGDLKFGRGVSVSPERNRQMMIYALGVIEKHQVQDDYDTVRLAISQPRNGGNSDWVISMADLLAFGEEVKATAARIAGVDAQGNFVLVQGLPLTPSEKACQFCKAKAQCPALKELIVSTMIDGFEAVVEKAAAKVGVPSSEDLQRLAEAPAETTPADRLGRDMQIADFAELWIKAKRAEVEAELLAGRPVTGWKLVQGKKGNRKWADEEAVEAMMKKFRLKKEEMYDFSIISPTAAEKLLAEQSPKRWEQLKPLYTQAEGGIHVAPASDKREPYIPEKPEDGFEEIDADLQGALDDLAAIGIEARVVGVERIEDGSDLI